ncbi:oxidation resistance protein 1 [Niveomyces insectorum RCEF 264]|uniref:Oxidation resistance protein 1 n=1 Tax=Niveomyces insectorum RCEF 264 TaxID=1081102 RepID=A0A162IAR6_9HYPO|nr:oxidation resistance protein 1 [Niveomyces insectorum RCEF 264]
MSAHDHQRPPDDRPASDQPASDRPPPRIRTRRQHTLPATPTSTSAGSASFLSNSLYGAFGGLLRRLSSDPAGHLAPPHGGPHDGGHYDGSSSSSSRSLHHPMQHSSTFPTATGTTNTTASHPHSSFSTHHHPSSLHPHNNNNGVDGVYTPPATSLHRSASPAPLPLLLSARLLTPAIAEEIRIMVPERLRIEDAWQLAYSLEQDGASLATLYAKTAAYAASRSGFVLVVQDQEGSVFGAYLTEYPHPAPHYFGTGECFLWRASLLAALPPPPSSDDATVGMPARQTTVAGHPDDAKNNNNHNNTLRFSAFPYSGVNEYFVYCEPHSLSVGGGDGRAGLWLDDSLEKGVSATCLTFGNPPLSDEGLKFGVLGVEVWVIGAR